MESSCLLAPGSAVCSIHSLPRDPMSLSDPRSPSVPGSSYDAPGAPPQPHPNLRIDRDVVMAYPTPILQREWPGNGPVNAALRDLILERERQDPGLPRANIGGWHSQ